MMGDSVSSRSPYGERGLKCLCLARVGWDRVSLPLRGAWIEIQASHKSVFTAQSLPLRGAWIEIILCLSW